MAEIGREVEEIEIVPYPLPDEGLQPYEPDWVEEPVEVPLEVPVLV